MDTPALKLQLVSVVVKDVHKAQLNAELAGSWACNATRSAVNGVAGLDVSTAELTFVTMADHLVPALLATLKDLTPLSIVLVPKAAQMVSPTGYAMFRTYKITEMFTVAGSMMQQQMLAGKAVGATASYAEVRFGYSA